MKRIILCLLLSYIGIQSYAQMMKNEVSFSSQSIWNRYIIAQGSLTPQELIPGKDWSNGGDITYSHYFYKGFFAIGGIGFNKQNFNVKRLIDYPTYPVSVYISFTSNYYYYENAQWLAGLGYDYKLHKHFGIKAKMIYSQSYSFKQHYQPNPNSLPAYVSHNKYVFGNSSLTIISGYYNISKRLSAGLDAIYPIFTKWRKDSIFPSEDPNAYFRPISSFGYGVSINCHFN